MKDELDHQIRARLDTRDFDGEELEACAVDLLRRDFPGLAPVPGGKDAGMDGVLPDGETFLVCTKGDVARNLNNSLDSHLKAGGRRRKVLLATCRKVTPAQRAGFEALATEKGFELMQVFEREAMAQRLRESPYWCRRLLGLSGAASILSKTPLSRRPRFEIPLIGREADLEWMRTTSGDRVLIGEPGSGKTSLLEKLVEESGSFFLVDANLAELGNEIREKDPRLVIVDDAHVDPPLLERLRQRREEIQAGFSILAVTWPGEHDKEAVFESLGIRNPGDSSKVHKLELLAREEILSIYRSLGVQAPDNVMRQLVTMAANRPGLAITLGQLCLENAWELVLRGEALSQEVVVPLRRMVGQEASDILAAISLGGDAGMGLEAVSEFLPMPLYLLRQKTADLAAGGVLARRNENRLAVIPAVLRRPLLRQVFFRPDAPCRDFEPLLAEAPSFDDAVFEIVVATGEEGLAPAKLQELVLRSRAPEVWSTFAGRGRREARWVLEHYPGDVTEIADSLLDEIPEEAAKRLLEGSSGRAVPSFREDPALAALSRWVRDIRASTLEPDEEVRRRRILAKAAREYLLGGGSRETGLHAIRFALSPTLQGSSRDPGAGTTLSLSFGLLRTESLRRMPEIWKEVRDSIGTIDQTAWSHLTSALWDWMHPTSAARTTNLPEQLVDTMRAVAIEVLQDLAPLAKSSPGARAGLRRLAVRAGIRLDLEIDPVFELLYPAEYVKLETRPDVKESLQRVAAQWSRRAPQAVAQDLAFYEAEADKIHFPRPGLGQAFGEALAGTVDDPELWLTHFLDANSGSNFVAPIMDRVVRERRPGWKQLLECSFKSRVYAWDATRLILMAAQVPESLLERALEWAKTIPQLVENLCLRREVPLPTLVRLLLHPAPEVALVAAIGEWGPVSERKIRPEITMEWREAVLRAKSEESDDAPPNVGLYFWLGVLLGSDSELALDWLVSQLREFPPGYVFPGSAFAQAVASLNQDQRLQLIGESEEREVPQGLLRLVVGRDLPLYRRLLASESLRDHQLEPLAGVPDETWLEMAIAALDSGRDSEEVASSAFDVMDVIAGPGVEYWQQWDQAFAALESHPRSDVREVAMYGRRIAGGHLTHAKGLQKQVRLQGF